MRAVQSPEGEPIRGVVMPQRFLRPGITNSERWNSVSFACQSLYVRILTLVDDYGRFDGRPSVIWGHCFAVWNEQNPDHPVDLQQVREMLQQLAAQKLILCFTSEGKQTLQVFQWQERIREGCRSKWPEPPSAAGCSDLPPSPPTPAPAPTNTEGPVTIEEALKFGADQHPKYEKRFINAWFEHREAQDPPWTKSNGMSVTARNWRADLTKWIMSNRRGDFQSTRGPDKDRERRADAVGSRKPKDQTEIPDEMRSYLIEIMGNDRDRVQKWKVIGDVPSAYIGSYFAHKKKKRSGNE